MPLTTTGKEFEHFVEHHLDQKGINYETQVQASGINESWSQIDIVIVNDDFTEEAISLKYQGGPGTADEKIPYETLSLQCMCEAHSYKQATIVLAGPGWHPVKYYYYLHEYKCPTKVRIISYDEFVQQYL